MKLKNVILLLIIFLEYSEVIAIGKYIQYSCACADIFKSSPTHILILKTWPNRTYTNPYKVRCILITKNYK